ncbi:MAG TPA: MFS transporter [Burkholderiales bacterium]|nr:MFS transporter [Burkholderiales bacterium]
MANETAEATAEAVGFFHPSKPAYRFTNLLFISSLTFGSYFAYDIIGAIAPSLVEGLHAGRKTVGAFNMMYSIAAIFVLLFAGFMIDRLGTRKAGIIFSVLVFAGAAIVWQAQSIPLMFLGRCVFGAGSEPLVVAQSAMLARWFKKKELALSFGVALTMSRLGSLFAFNNGEFITKYYGSFRKALLVAVGACALSLLGNVCYIIMDKRGEKVLALRDESAGDKIVLKDIKKFKATFWYVTFLCLTFYAAVFPFQSLSTDFFHTKWGIRLTAPSSGGFLDQVFSNFGHIFSTAGGISSIIIFASMILAPFAGRLVDRVGKRATFMIAGSLLMIPCHLAMGLTMVWPVYPMVLLGFAFVLVPAAMWPSVPLIVRSESVGTAFGLMTAIQNVGLGLFPFLDGVLRDKTGNYVASQVMFASLGLIGLAFALLLKRADRRENRGLEVPQKAAAG